MQQMHVTRAFCSFMQNKATRIEAEIAKVAAATRKHTRQCNNIQVHYSNEENSESSQIHSVATVNKIFIQHKYVNPLLPIAHKSARIDKISILKLEGIIKKISYERRDYESVDEKSLSKAMSRKTTKKRIQALKG